METAAGVVGTEWGGAVGTPGGPAGMAVGLRSGVSGAGKYKGHPRLGRQEQQEALQGAMRGVLGVGPGAAGWRWRARGRQ